MLNRINSTMNRGLLLALAAVISISYISSCKPGGGGDNPDPGANYTLVIEIVGEGTVSEVAGSYPSGTRVTITAEAGNGYTVASWDGADDRDSVANTNTVTMTGDKTVYVIFLLNSHSDRIENIDAFLERCPDNDPALPLILHDFGIRREGEFVSDYPCSEPVSAIPLPDFYNRFIILQTLRTIYHMDWGEEGHLPWAPSTLYRWMRSKIRGIDIRTDISFTNCCTTYEDGLYISFAAIRIPGNFELFKKWEGIAAMIALLAHETRHVDGYFHVDCCGIPGGCDENYDESDLSAYGIQWYLNHSWLTGTINVGISCLPAERTAEIADFLRKEMSIGLNRRFCYIGPPWVEIPAQPGGPCNSASVDERLSRQ